MSAKSVTLRASQLIIGFGPGAMVDLPTRSVVIGGLDLWHMREAGSWRPIQEPRAVAVLEALLRGNGRLADDQRLSLRTPPVHDDARRAAGTSEPPGVEARIFPAWFVARDAEEAGEVRRRRLVRWRDLDPRGRADFVDDDGRRVAVTPIRFVAGCRKGHLQDIDWGYTVHIGSEERCVQPMWLEERGTSGDPASTRVVCGCGKSLSLKEAQASGILGACRGRRPWLVSDEPDGCRENLRFLSRTATNAYFPQVLTVISLPTAEDDLSALVEEHLDAIDWVETVDEIAVARRANPALRAAFLGWSDADVVARIAQIRANGRQALARAPRAAEFDLLASGLDVIGSDAPDAKLHARTLTRGDWDGDRARLAPIDSVVAVPRTRGDQPPQQGDIVVLRRGKNSAQGHVGFFEGFDQRGNVKVLGGNQSDGVNTKSFNRNDVLGFRRAPNAAQVAQEEQKTQDDLLKKQDKFNTSLEAPPHPRGSTLRGGHRRFDVCGSPAPAGINPVGTSDTETLARLPRTRGDQPRLGTYGCGLR